MGQEIETSRFSQADFEQFSQKLREETGLLHDWAAQGRFQEGPYQGGYELEAWLLDQHCRPAAENQRLLEKLDNPLVVPELARFNIELNGHQQTLQGMALADLHDELAQTWRDSEQAAAAQALQIGAIGILPTAKIDDFCVANMSQLQRYQALNEQVMRMRHGVPLQLQINGAERLDMSHPDVMLEAATTSFQIHLRMPFSRAVRVYNAGKMVAGPMTAIAANSPFFLGHDLWAETRIPLFEQAIMVGQSDLTRRVSFGIRYANSSILEVFDSNLARYPILLPRVIDQPPESLSHLRLHNGTIWRWNRPLIGFDDAGEPHVRLEHRCVPAGPSVVDAIANAALFYGLVVTMAESDSDWQMLLPFPTARNNFYRCARDGLQAEIEWPKGKTIAVRKLFQESLLPMAQQGLERLEIAPGQVRHWLSVLYHRVETGQNGAAWQRAWVRRHGRDLQALMRRYLHNQQMNIPVSSWSLDD